MNANMIGPSQVYEIEYVEMLRRLCGERKAALAERDQRIVQLETIVRNLTTMRDDERTCGELSADECTERYMAQRERIKALELAVRAEEAAVSSQAERMAELEAERQEMLDTHAAIVAERCAPDEQHCTCVPALRQRIAELEAERDEFQRKYHEAMDIMSTWQNIDSAELAGRLTETIKDHDALIADLRAVAEALMLVDEYHDDYPLEMPDAAMGVLKAVDAALARPGVQAMLTGTTPG